MSPTTGAVMNVHEHTIKTIIDAHSNPELAKQVGMVYQVWEDGEVTLTKSGELLGRRSLHMIRTGIDSLRVSPSLFPHQSKDGNHGFAYVTDKGAAAIREAIIGDAYEHDRS
jgi:hypothetical protein